MRVAHSRRLKRGDFCTGLMPELEHVLTQPDVSVPPGEEARTHTGSAKEEEEDHENEATQADGARGRDAGSPNAVAAAPHVVWLAALVTAAWGSIARVR